jgi:hypothetical protein
MTMQGVVGDSQESVSGNNFRVIIIRRNGNGENGSNA